MNVTEHNRKAWDKAVQEKSVWTVPVGPDEITAARRGEWCILLTPEKCAPRTWFPADLQGVDILCLASGGGQQGPLLAAAGATVTVFDNSPGQLAQDRLVARREGLTITPVEGDMADLSVFDDAQFDLIVHPCSNLFVPDVRPVWREAHRVLRPGGRIMAGFMNPVFYLFDAKLADRGQYEVRYELPYSDVDSLPPKERDDYIKELSALEFGHTLTDQIGGQLDAGFRLVGFYEDRWTGQALSEWMEPYIATLAEKG
ncbi:MAG: class I SAM-dependent methyltransferase [Caldilineaceae bacterium]|nr:class I SAM-dependent methyltransferase [Caldilineaceae bacterium]